MERKCEIDGHVSLFFILNTIPSLSVKAHLMNLESCVDTEYNIENGI
jgi:hypothetical protein